MMIGWFITSSQTANLRQHTQLECIWSLINWMNIWLFSSSWQAGISRLHREAHRITYWPYHHLDLSHSPYIDIKLQGIVIIYNNNWFVCQANIVLRSREESFIYFPMLNRYIVAFWTHVFHLHRNKDPHASTCINIPNETWLALKEVVDRH